MEYSAPGIARHPTAAQSTPAELPDLSHILSITEMETLAMQRMSQKAISYYTSATDDQITKGENSTIYRSIQLRPRVLVDCTECDLSTTVLGHKLGIPLFVSPAALATLAHPVGEAGIAGACSSFKSLGIISQNAGLPLKDIVQAGPEAVFGWQLYVVKDIEETRRKLALLKEIRQVKFIVLTVDAPFPGKREIEVRYKMGEVAAGGPPQVWGTESALTWKKTLAWLQTETDLPIVLKGIQTYEDAYAATLFPAVKGIILSNHGGRALDTVAPPVQVLLEIRKFCPQVLRRVDVLIDGGIKRGTDIVKALALGAKAVGIGRAPLFGLAVGGQQGVERTIQILVDETMTAMRLLGATKVSHLRPRHVNTSALTARLYDGPAALDDVEREVMGEEDP
ncbi:Cytochrome b2-like protein [Hapsidospora chrysogenum ATCC 11550]|uniref:Cytochrome b2-like protein n=1 Tax=Hapsidospora chrysogenum (strain ATCC 11550 / CBS 779.69 / DSM 880 / IAM 14645 / JCM 23072 / IMI 49137) TaxID=857340 RepID=A0A086THR6_HAPC1|nr:Cytochrome b2-like protein [Hapsidospora chrysogenum ATCC 11550]